MRTAIVTSPEVPHAATGLVTGALAAARSLLHFLGRCYVISSERRELARLDARMLADLGLAVEFVSREVERPCWSGHDQRWPDRHARAAR